MGRPKKSKLFISILLATLQVGLGQDTFNEKPVVNRKFEVPVPIDPEKTYDPFTNETDSSAFNDSAIIDELNEQYLHRMVARTAAIALASLSADLKECKEEDSQCSRWPKKATASPTLVICPLHAKGPAMYVISQFVQIIMSVVKNGQLKMSAPRTRDICVLLVENPVECVVLMVQLQ